MIAGHRRFECSERSPLHSSGIRVKLRWAVGEFRVHHIVELDHCSAVSRFATHQGRHGAVSDLLTFIQFSVFDDRVNEVNMLLNVRINGLALESPVLTVFWPNASAWIS